MESLKEAPFAAEPLFTHYLDFTWQKLHDQEERLLNCTQNLLIHPLQKLYDMDIKRVDLKKKHFEDVSKDYYANLAKYLSIKTPKKQQRTESDFLSKKKEFDLARFDYYTFLRDLYGGKKEQEILYHLLNLYEKQYSYFYNVQKTLEPHKQGLDDLATLIAEASREQKMVNQERDEKRKIIVSKYKEDEDNQLLQQQQSKRKSFSPMSPTSNQSFSPIDNITADDATTDTATDPPPSIGLGISLENSNKFKGIRDLEQQDQTYKNNIERRKEGFLFATSKPFKNHHHLNTPSFEMASSVNWHKYWCVLSGGQLHEYSNWKKHLETHIEPINLRFATVREARNVDRRFCFEVITPNFRRMYQATSAEELSSWIGTINNAISSLLNGLGSSVDIKENLIPTSSTTWTGRMHAKSLSGALSGLAAAKDKYLLKKRHSRNLKKGTAASLINVGGSTTVPTPSLPEQQRQESSDLLIQLRKDVSNTECADCSAKNPDWCSLNLGILLCIECSGIHRSLGTHISKVRSLTLDSASFTADITQLLLSIGNEKSNKVWERNAIDKKPIPTDTREVKLKYIQRKYVDKSFVQGIEYPPMTLLYKAIETDDIPLALHAIALGADVNQPFSLDLLSPVVPLIPASVLELPVLDVAGNEYRDRSLIVNSSISSADFIVRYALHFALLQHQELVNDCDSDSVDSSCSSSSQEVRVFPMAEFLFQNGADVYIVDTTTKRLLADLVGLGQLVDNEAITYLNMKNSLRGQSAITRSHVIPPPHT
ncbi:unnamed protein product [Mucor hiemalis]